MTMELETEFLKRHRNGQDTDAQMCEWQDCPHEGAHRAPKSRDELNTFRWFCTVHAREYNRSWNYYDGMSDDEVEADVRQDTVWHRPTWRLGSNDPANLETAINFDSINDPFDILKNARSDGSSSKPSSPSYSPDIIRALSVFELTSPGNVDTVKQRYKELVKRYHPDAKGLKSGSDEKIKNVNAAYNILIDFVTC